MNGEPALARPVGTAGKAWRWCRRQPIRAGLIAALIAVSVLGLAGVLSQWRHAQSQRARAEAEAYAADMNLVQRALEGNDLGGALELLNRHRPGASAERGMRNAGSGIDLRGWEWRYLWARCQSEERFTLCQYSNAVSALAFSPDGKWLAVRREDWAVAVWDVATKRQLAEVPVLARGSGWANRALAFSPRENLLAWGDADANGKPIIRLAHVGAQEQIAPLAPSDELLSVGFSPDGKALAALAYDGTVRVWELESQRRVTEFLTAKGFSRQLPLFSAASAPAAEGTVGSGDNNSPPVGISGPRNEGRARQCGCVLFSPDGRWLAIGEVEPRIRLRDRTTGEERVISVPEETYGITALAFSPDSRLLAAACGAGRSNLLVWDIVARQPVHLAGHRGWIMGLAFSPDGKTLASASTDQTIRLWDMEHQLERRPFRGDTNEVWAVAWSPDGTNLVTGASDGTVRFWDPAAKPVKAYEILPVAFSFYGLTFLPDSRRLLTVTSPEGTVVSWEAAWEAATLKKVESLAFLGSNHISVALSPDGHWLALSDNDGNIQIWDFPARRRVASLVFPGSRMLGVFFSPRGLYLHVGAFAPGRGWVTKMWETTGWREVSLEGINLKDLCDGALARDERTLALGHDGTADWWDLATRKRLALFDLRTIGGVRVRFSPDGRYFAMAGRADGRMLLCDVATRTHLPIGRRYRSGLHDLVFTMDSRRLITIGTSPDDVGKIWDVETGRDVVTLPGKPGFFFHHIGLSPDGNTLFADSLEGVALLWHAPSWDEIETREKQQRAP